MTEKQTYLSPETEEITLCLENTLLDASTTGFTDDPDYNENHWVIM